MPKIIKKAIKKEYSDDESCEEDEDEEEEEEEDGQILIPKGIIMDDINDIKANETYILVYIRHKTDSEILIEKEVCNIMNLKLPILKYIRLCNKKC